MVSRKGLGEPGETCPAFEAIKAGEMQSAEVSLTNLLTELVLTFGDLLPVADANLIAI